MVRFSIFILSLIFVFNAFAQGPKSHRPLKNPKPLFDRPVKVDRSGRPLYNTWQKQEHERKIRFEQRQMLEQRPDSDPSLYETNAATSETSTTPSSAITNRPIQVQEEIEPEDEESIDQTN